MKAISNAALAVPLVLCGALVSGAAMAQHHGHGGVRFGLYLGVPFYGPGYYPYPPAPYYPYGVPAYGYPPVAAAPAAPRAYVERNPASMAYAPAQPQGNWYYCADSNTYYPYVRVCPAGWQRVPAQPAAR